MKKSRFFKPLHDGEWTDASYWMLKPDGSWYVKYPNGEGPSDNCLVWEARPDGPWGFRDLSEIYTYLDEELEWVEFIEIDQDDMFLDMI